LSILTSIVRPSAYRLIAAILSALQALVNGFQYRLPLQKADRMVGLFPIWLTCIIPLGLTRRKADGESIHRASDSPPATVQNMGVYHRGAHVGVPEQFLNRADIVAIFQQIRGNAFKPFDLFEPFESLERLSRPFKLLAFHRAVLQITDKVANHN